MLYTFVPQTWHTGWLSYVCSHFQYDLPRPGPVVYSCLISWCPEWCFWHIMGIQKILIKSGLLKKVLYWASDGQILRMSRQLAYTPEGSQNLVILHNAGVWAQMLQCLSTSSGRGLQVCFATDDSSHNFGFMEDPSTLSAVPFDSKMFWHLMGSCCKMSGVGTSPYAVSLMKNVFGPAFLENPPLIYLVCYRFISLVLQSYTFFLHFLVYLGKLIFSTIIVKISLIGLNKYIVFINSFLISYKLNTGF